MDSEAEKCDKEKESECSSDEAIKAAKCNNPIYEHFYGQVKIEGLIRAMTAENILEFPQTIYMDRYLEENNNLRSSKREDVRKLMECRKVIKSQLLTFTEFGSDPKQKYPLLSSAVILNRNILWSIFLNMPWTLRAPGQRICPRRQGMTRCDTLTWRRPGPRRCKWTLPATPPRPSRPPPTCSACTRQVVQSCTSQVVHQPTSTNRPTRCRRPGTWKSRPRLNHFLMPGRGGGDTDCESAPTPMDVAESVAKPNVGGRGRSPSSRHQAREWARVEVLKGCLDRYTTIRAFTKESIGSMLLWWVNLCLQFLNKENK